MNNQYIGKHLIALLGILLLLGSVVGTTGVGAQSADGEVSLSPNEVSLEQGESQTIAITYERISAATPQGIEYTLAYDSNIIDVTDQSQGDYFNGNAFVNDISTPDKVEYAEVILSGNGTKKNNGTVATITIEPVSVIDTSETTTIEFATAKASAGATEFSVITRNTTVEIVPDTEDTEVPSSNDSPASRSGSSENSETTTAPDDMMTNETSTVPNTTNQSSSTDTEQTTNSNNSSESNNTSERETNGAVPGFGMMVAVLSILSLSYVIRILKK